jgi:hypothetical protein
MATTSRLLSYYLWFPDGRGLTCQPVSWAACSSKGRGTWSLQRQWDAGQHKQHVPRLSPLDQTVVTQPPFPQQPPHPHLHRCYHRSSNSPSTNLQQCTNNVKHSATIIGREVWGRKCRINLNWISVYCSCRRYPACRLTACATWDTWKVIPILEMQISLRCWYSKQLFSFGPQG